jgi:RNA polymerase sigma-70 factor, ECF subfamily
VTTLSVAWARLHGIRVAWRNEASGTELAAPGSGGHRPAARPEPAPAHPAQADTAAYPDWDAIYTDNVGRIYRLLFAKVGNRQDAEDLTSQVFLAALGPLRATASVGEVRAYLLATARTALAAHWRRTLGHQVTVIDPAGMDLAEFAGTADGSRPGGPPGPGVPDSGAADPGRGSGLFDEDDPRVRAGRILAALPERQRRILSLRFLEGASVKEAAAELGVTVANAKVMQHRALRRAAGLGWQPDQSMGNGKDKDPDRDRDLKPGRAGKPGSALGQDRVAQQQDSKAHRSAIGRRDGKGTRDEIGG